MQAKIKNVAVLTISVLIGIYVMRKIPGVNKAVDLAFNG